MYCEKCGRKLEDGELFCQQCGTKRPDIFIQEETADNRQAERVPKKRRTVAAIVAALALRRRISRRFRKTVHWKYPSMIFRIIRQ